MEMAETGSGRSGEKVPRGASVQESADAATVVLQFWLEAVLPQLADSTLWASSPIAVVCHEFNSRAPINSKEPIMGAREHREAWNKGKLVGQKAPLKPKDIWAIRIHLQNEHAVRDLAMLNLAIDSKLRGCDLVSLRVRDVTHGNQVLPRTMVVQRKTQRPVQFELTEPTRTAVAAWMAKANLRSEDFLFPSRLHASPHVSTRQYARIVEHWVAAAGLDPSAYGTHSMRRTKATLIYKRTKSRRAVQLLLGHSKL